MNLKESIRNNLKSMKAGIGRMPLSLISSIIYGILYIISSEKGYGSNPSWQAYRRIFFLATLLFIGLGLLAEKDKLREKKAAINLGGILIVLGLFFYFKFRPGLEADRAFIFLNLFIIVGILFLGRERANNYEFYIIDLAQAFLIAFLYSAIIYLGTIFIVFTIVELFGLSLDPNIYSYIFVIVVTSFSNLLFISKLPEGNRDYSSRSLSKVSDSLIRYILIPLLLVYTAIIYLYFAKVLIAKNWPKNIISRLVIWYGLVALGVLFFTGGQGEDSFLAGFRKHMPRLIMPGMLMMLMAIYMRIRQYGFTENRYYLMLGGLWLFTMMAYYLIVRYEKNIVLPISLSIVILLTSLEPLSGTRVALRSQNKRYEKLLIKYDILVDGKIHKRPDLDLEARKEISGALDIFRDPSNLKSLKYTSMESLDELEDQLGFKYIDFYERQDINNYFNYSRAWGNKIYNIEDYSSLVFLDSNGDLKELKQKDIYIQLKDKYQLEIGQSGEKLSIDLPELILKDQDKLEGSRELAYEFKEGRIKIIIENVAGSLDEDRIQLDEIRLLLLFK